MVAAEDANGNAGAVVAVSAPRAALLDSDAEGLETQTRKIGLIYPPPDIRAIADKTALYVAKNGPDFERRVRANEAENTRFNFLKPGDPYHAYYQHKLAENIAVLSGEAPAGTQEQPSAAPVAPPPRAPVPAPRAEPAPVLVPTQPLSAPAEAQYTVAVPEGLTGLDLDVIRLAAAAVARNGKRFLSDLAAREQSNPQFNFLKPTHSLFAFFTALCDAYSRVLMPPRGLLDELRADAADRARPLERALRRLEWGRVREREAQDTDAAAEAERMAMLQIDWHDFVVVECIDFYDDEAAELPAPMTLREVLRAARAAGDAAVTQDDGARAEPGADAAAPASGVAPAMDAEEAALVAAGAAAGEGNAPSAGAGEGSALGSGPVRAGPASTATVVVPGAETEDVDMEESDDEAEAAPVRVVRDYVRPAARAPRADPTGYVTSPFTGELIAVGDMAEHARVSLLDPRWAQQRHTMLSRLRDSARASDEEISRNLASLARTLPDVFGKSEEELGQALDQGLRAERQAAASADGTHATGALNGDGALNGGTTTAGAPVSAAVSGLQQNSGLGPLLQPDGAATGTVSTGIVSTGTVPAGMMPPQPAGLAPPQPAGMMPLQPAGLAPPQPAIPVPPQPAIPVPPQPAIPTPPASQRFPAGMAPPGMVQPRVVLPPAPITPPEPAIVSTPALQPPQPPLPTDSAAPAEPAEPQPSVIEEEDDAKEPPAPKVYPKGMAAPAAPGTAEAAKFSFVPRSNPGVGLSATPALPTAAPPVLPPPPSFAGPGLVASSAAMPPSLAPPVMAVPPSTLLQPVSAGSERPPVVDEPAAKRPRLETLVPEEEWLERHPGPAEVAVTSSATANVEALQGQTSTERVPGLDSTVLALKEGLAAKLGLPANRLRLSVEGLGFLREELSLAHYNVAPGDTLVLSMKERGGRRK